ncbi:MAG: flagellar motor protein MotB [Myxococcota bacterium]|nr:flagellar motor protein MotB [Myxococcota bacterium]
MSDEDDAFEEPTAPAWMATFGDLMSLLLCFFVLLLSFASMDAKRFAEVNGSMRDAFGVQRIDPGQFEALSDDLISLNDRPQSSSLRVIEMPSRDPSSTKKLASRIKTTLAAKRLDRLVEVDETERGVVVRVPGQMLFSAGSTELRPTSLVFLREIADLMQGTPDLIAIEGHTDAAPSQSTTTNWRISTARAVAALEYLVDVGRVSPDRLRATGFAATRPVASNEDEAGRAKNRRVEFTFLRPQDGEDS